jgi:hypothetical protein
LEASSKRIMERGSVGDSTPSRSGEARSAQLLQNLTIISNIGGTMEGFLLRLLAIYLDGEDHDGTQDGDEARSGSATFVVGGGNQTRRC